MTIKQMHAYISDKVLPILKPWYLSFTHSQFWDDFLKGLNLNVLSFYFMINFHHLVFPIVSFDYIFLRVIWTVKDTTKYQRSRLQTFVVPKSGHYKAFEVSKKRTLQNICSLKKEKTTKYLYFQKSGHHKRFVVSKKRTLQKICSLKKADTTKDL